MEIDVDWVPLGRCAFFWGWTFRALIYVRPYFQRTCQSNFEKGCERYIPHSLFKSGLFSLFHLVSACFSLFQHIKILQQLLTAAFFLLALQVVSCAASCCTTFRLHHLSHFRMKIPSVLEPEPVQGIVGEVTLSCTFESPGCLAGAQRFST